MPLARRTAALRERTGAVAAVVGAAVRPALVRVTPAARVVTRLGWSVLFVSVVLLLLGAALGWVEVRLLAVFGLAALAVATAFTIGRSAYRVALDLAVDRVVVGHRAVGRVRVANASGHALLPATIELPIGGTTEVFALPRLAAGAAHEASFIIPTHRRGVLPVGPLRSVRGDPFGMLRRVVRWTEPQQLFVHPRTVALANSAAGLLKDLEGDPSRELSNSDVSFHALREYSLGDDRRHVHWKTYARTRTLMVRQFEETRRTQIAIGISVAGSEHPDSDAPVAIGFELAVSAAGSVGLQALADGRAVSLVAQNVVLRSSGRRELLDALAGVELVPDGDVIALARAVGRRATEASVVVLSVGPQTKPAQLRAAAQHLPRGARVLVLRCAPGAEPSRRMLGEIVVLTVPTLEELPRILQRGDG